MLVSYDPKRIPRLRAFAEGQGEDLGCITRSGLGLTIVIGVEDLGNLVIFAVIAFVRFDIRTKFFLLLDLKTSQFHASSLLFFNVFVDAGKSLRVTSLIPISLIATSCSVCLKASNWRITTMLSSIRRCSGDKCRNRSEMFHLY